ncbi:MAG TPA: hypothetical protein VHJ78_03415, partial [Actinomycetota bacterium]|nr:hypothetical protein [Actinomycetota bacterium]
MGKPGKAVGRVAGLVAMLVLLAFPAPAAAQTQAPPGGLGLDPVLQIVCDLTGLLCPPPGRGPALDPAAPQPSNVPAPPPAPIPDGEPLSSGTASDLGAVPLASPAGRVADIPAPSVQALSPPAVPQPPARPVNQRRVPSDEEQERPLSLPPPAEVDISPRTVAVAAGVSLIGLILIGFPAELFNKTLRNNYERLRRLFRRKDPMASVDTPRQVAALVASAAVAGLLATVSKLRDGDPGAAAVVALAVGIAFLVTVGVNEAVAAAVGERLGVPRRIFRAYPAGLPVLAFFVAVSALGRLDPPYLYGHLAGSKQEAKPVDPGAEAMQTASGSFALLIL